MAFRFRITKVWQFERLPTIHAIGLLEGGKIIPPVQAHVIERDGQTVQVESIVLSGGHLVTGKQNELTLKIGGCTLDPQSLEGCQLINDVP